MFIRKLTYGTIIGAGLVTVGKGIELNSINLVMAGVVLISLGMVLWITQG